MERITRDGHWMINGEMHGVHGVGGVWVADMYDPVRCRCGQVYDLGTVEVTASYADCSMWKTPCCGTTADDRGETGWKSFSDYTPLRRPPRR